MSQRLNFNYVSMILRKFDIGGVNPSHTVEGQGILFKSVFGGFMSTLMILLSVCYTFYVCQLYYKNEIPPKSQNSQSTIEYQELKFDYNPLSFFFVTNSALSMPNPFQQDKIILIPNVQIVKNLQVIKTGQLLPEINNGINSISLMQSNLTDIAFIHDQELGGNETQISVTFLKCIPQLLVGNQSCASQSEMDQFFATPLKIIKMKVNFKEFNSKTFVFDTKTKSYYFLFDESQTLYTQIILRTKQTIVENIMPFQKSLDKIFLSSVEVQPESVTKDYFQRYFLVEGYANFLIRLDSVKEFDQIIFPNYSEVLAQIGPVLNIIFWMKFIVSFYNSRQYQNKLVGMIMAQSQFKGQNESGSNIQFSQDKISALSRINIFNIHMELFQMRQILDQIMAKKQEHDNIEINPSLNLKIDDLYKSGFLKQVYQEQYPIKSKERVQPDEELQPYQVYPKWTRQQLDKKIDDLFQKNRQKSQIINENNQSIELMAADFQYIDVDEKEDYFYQKPKNKDLNKGVKQ